MINTNYFKDKSVTIVGLARSGVACANLLYDLGANVSVTDNKDNAAIRGNVQKLKSEQIRLELGQHTQEFIKGRDLLVVSPGVPNGALPIVWANSLKIPIISEIELAWILSPAQTIAVTGSNGKTTVTTLIAQILKARGSNVFSCGNIGNPFSADVEKMQEGDFVSLEVSSFQLEHIQKFRPKIAAILNFTSNHLDRYQDMQEYLQAKKRIFMNQDKTDYLVLNEEDPVVKGLARETKSQVIYFTTRDGLNPNQAAVLAVGNILGIDTRLIDRVFREFKGIEHRLEYVAEINKVKFVNDSKATTADSTLWALRNIDNPILLIAGGRDKGVDYRVILDIARRKVRNIILIGEAKEKIKSALSSLSINEATSLEEAVNIAYAKARPGDCVLLSPMCSSFDMFSDYEERGRVFKNAVYSLMRNTALIKSR